MKELLKALNESKRLCEAIIANPFEGVDVAKQRELLDVIEEAIRFFHAMPLGPTDSQSDS